VSYNGDTNFNISSGSLTQTVGSLGSTTTNVVSSLNPSTVGQSVTFTATVAPIGGGGGVPTGVVSFKDGVNVLGTVTLSGGVASFTTSALGGGSHSISASYSGDTNFNGSSGSLTQTVSGNTTTSVTSSLNPSNVGQSVTFTATVTPIGGGGVPTGTVSFKDGGSLLGTSTLSGGITSITTSTLTIGNHSITAIYSGSATFATSASAAFAQVVNAPVDSAKLHALQALAAPMVAQSSGQAIAGAVESAIEEAFTGGGFATPSAAGMRFNFAADPDARPLQSAGPFGSANGSSDARSQNVEATAYAGAGKTGRVDNAFDALANAMPTKAAPRYVEQPDWLGWAEVHGTTLDHSGTGGSGTPLLWGNQVNVLAGLTRRVLPNFVVGALGGYETFDYRSDALQGRLKGDGWTIGSYLGWVIAQSVRFDAAVTYSGIGYDGLAGTATGSFPGQRWLLSSGVTGSYRTNGFLIEPSARVYALWEHEDAYTDSLGTLQTSHDFSTGRASGGVKVARPIAWSPTAAIAPYVGLYSDYYFSATDAGALVAPAVPTRFVLDGWSARVTSGVTARFTNGGEISIGGERAGIGGNFALWTYRLRASVPLDAR
jgi:hypothetical protein